MKIPNLKKKRSSDLYLKHRKILAKFILGQKNTCRVGRQIVKYYAFRFISISFLVFLLTYTEEALIFKNQPQL